MTRILSTHAYAHHPPAWAERVDVLDRRELSRRELFGQIVRRAAAYDALILNGSIGAGELYLDLVAGLVVRRTRRRPPAMLFTDCSWQLGARSADRAAMRAGIRALDGPRVRYCVRSRAELELFPRTWGVDPRHVAFTSYAHTVTPDELAVPATTDGGVFAGGNSLRDYDTLLDAVHGLDVPVRIETKVIPPERLAGLPAHVDVSAIRSHDAFVDGLRRAAVVVTPILPAVNRAAGLDTYLSAMALGKVVIVTESPGVSDYVEHGRTGLVVPPADAAALRDAIAWSLDPAHADEAAAIAAAAREAAHTRFTYVQYVESLLRIADEAVATT